jgi:hypothetical protein
MVFDLESLIHASGRNLSASEIDEYNDVQRQANRWTYLGSGMTHPNFLATLARLYTGARERIEQIAPAFC